jgi:hypothetical protein
MTTSRVSAICALVLMTRIFSLGQPTQTITFDELLRNRVEKKFSWTNPDSSREEITVVEMQIPVDDEMKNLTARFIKDNYNRNSIWVEPRMIVIHSMDLEDLRSSIEKSSFLYHKMPPTWTTVAKAGPLPSGAHFIIDSDGTIYCLTPPSSTTDEAKISYERGQHRWLVRRHLDAVPFALGIENVTKKDSRYNDLSDQQIISNAKLVRWLLWLESDSVQYVMSHHQFNDTTRFEKMMKTFSLAPRRPLIRPWRRQDVGNVVIQKITSGVKTKGWKLKDDF